MSRFFRIASIIFSLYVNPVFAQLQPPCEAYPANCPDAESINNAQSKEICCTDNGITKAEFAMQNTMRSAVEDMLKETTAKENWKMEEFGELFQVIAKQSDDNIVPDNLRPPHVFSIAFQVIVNEDSLKLWRKWLENYNSRVMSEVQSAKPADEKAVNDVSANTQNMADSIAYYAKQQSDYVVAHSQEYQNAISNNNQAYIEKWNKQMAYFNSKSSAVSDKIDKQAKASQPNYYANQTALLNEHDKMMLQFKNACIVQVFVQCNKEVGVGLKNLVKTSSLPGATEVCLFSNPHPDPKGNDWYFGTFPNIEEILLGDFQPQRDKYNGYKAVFATNRENTNSTSPKKVLSNKVQVVSIHICGRKDKVEKLASLLNLSKLNALITR